MEPTLGTGDLNTSILLNDTSSDFVRVTRALHRLGIENKLVEGLSMPLVR